MCHYSLPITLKIKLFHFFPWANIYVLSISIQYLDHSKPVEIRTVGITNDHVFAPPHF